MQLKVASFVDIFLSFCRRRPFCCTLKNDFSLMPRRRSASHKCLPTAESSEESEKWNYLTWNFTRWLHHIIAHKATSCQSVKLKSALRSRSIYRQCKIGTSHNDNKSKSFSLFHSHSFLKQLRTRHGRRSRLNDVRILCLIRLENK